MSPSVTLSGFLQPALLYVHLPLLSCAFVAETLSKRSQIAQGAALSISLSTSVVDSTEHLYHSEALE